MKCFLTYLCAVTGLFANIESQSLTEFSPTKKIPDPIVNEAVQSQSSLRIFPYASASKTGLLIIAASGAGVSIRQNQYEFNASVHYSIMNLFFPPESTSYTSCSISRLFFLTNQTYASFGGGTSLFPSNRYFFPLPFLTLRYGYEGSNGFIDIGITPTFLDLYFPYFSLKAKDLLFLPLLISGEIRAGMNF